MSEHGDERWRPKNDTMSQPTEEFGRLQAMHGELVALEDAMKIFLDGEISRGRITPYKMTLLVSAQTLLAVSRSARRDLLENKVALG